MVTVPLSVTVTLFAIRTLAPVPTVRVAPCTTVTFWPKVEGAATAVRVSDAPDAIDRMPFVSFSERAKEVLVTLIVTTADGLIVTSSALVGTALPDQLLAVLQLKSPAVPVQETAE